MLRKPSIEQFFQHVVRRTMAVVRPGRGPFVPSDRAGSEPPWAPGAPSPLTSLQLSVAADVVGGYTPREIALRLGLPESAVSEIFTSTLESLGVSNPLELMLFASYHHLFDRPPQTPSNE